MMILSGSFKPTFS
uniref:Uncharacterized protein n=1 Tax=Anguilla anguilla TaxID=7936 RepID=A0A0E9PXL7_ANGAN